LYRGKHIAEERNERLPSAASDARDWRGKMGLSNELQTLADGRAFRLCSGGREEIGIKPISCPVCHAANSRRSKRRSVHDHLLGFAGVLPWRCESCEARFHARTMPLRLLFYAHCAICGNFELQRISADRVPHRTAIFWRILRLPALRCDPCRHKFFSVRPLRREEPRVVTAQGGH